MSQLVTFKPAILNFPPPLNKIVPASLILSNTSHSYVVFKIKSNAPTRYTVRPTKGVIGPEEQFTVQIIFAFSRAVPGSINELKSDKFLLEVLPLPLQTDLTLATARIDDLIKSSPEKLEKHLIKVSFKEVPRKVPFSGGDGSHSSEAPSPIPSIPPHSLGGPSINSTHNVSNQSFFSINDISSPSIDHDPLPSPLSVPSIPSSSSSSSSSSSFEAPVESVRPAHADSSLGDSLTFRGTPRASNGNQIAALNDKIDRLQAERDQLLDSLARLKSQVSTTQKQHLNNAAIARNSNIKLFVIAIIFFILGNFFRLF